MFSLTFLQNDPFPHVIQVFLSCMNLVKDRDCIYICQRTSHYFFFCKASYHMSTWWSERKNFQESVMAKCFFVKPSEARTVSLEQLAAMFFSIKLAVIWVIAQLCTVCETRVITKTKQLVRKISWILWRSPLFQLLFLATRLTKESSFDWFKSHYSLFKSQ